MNPALQTEITTHIEIPQFWTNSSVGIMLEAQRKRGWTPTALITDFDKSYFSISTRVQTERLAQITHKHDIPTVIVTGRPIDSLQQTICEQHIPPPEIIVSAVGTEIWVKEKSDIPGKTVYIRDGNFDQLLRSKQFDRKQIVTTAQDMITQWNNNAERQQRHLVFQNPAVEQAFLKGNLTTVEPYKVSFNAFANDASRDQLAQEIASFFPNAHIAVSEDVIYNDLHPDEIKNGADKKYCIDLLPIIPKAEAINYITDTLGIKRGFNIGDSGNDLPLILQTKIGEKVVVGGARDELRHLVLGQVREIPGTGFSHILMPEGKPTGIKIFDGTKSGTKTAGSIIEAAIARLRVTLRFEKNPQFKEDIQQIIEELKGTI